MATAEWGARVMSLLLVLVQDGNARRAGAGVDDLQLGAPVSKPPRCGIHVLVAAPRDGHDDNRLLPGSKGPSASALANAHLRTPASA